mgnify:CR=1 FL=1
MSNFTDFIGGGGSASYPTFFLHKSQTWVPPQDGNICIHVIGAGGGGAGYSGTPRSGAAGGYSKKNTLAVTTSGSFTVVIGAHGNGAAGNSGTAGGNSTVAGTGLSATLTANGGAGGIYDSGTAAGGTASGGDVNNTGGDGVYIGGGGGVGLTGAGEQGSSYNSSYRAGGCDVVGNFWTSTMGQLAGGKGPLAIFQDNFTGYPPQRAEPLSGGAQNWTGASQGGQVSGGDGGFGGGGGQARHASTSNARGGDGGEGIVVIQYIP